MGKRRLEKAIEKSPQFDFKVTWLPFFLNPNAPFEPQDKLEVYNKKFGAARVGPMFERLKKVGEEDGIAFNYDGKTGNTLHSHRLVDYASKEGKQDAVINGLFRAYFEEAKTIQNFDVLCEIAKEAGLKEDEVRSYLESDKNRDETFAQASALALKYKCSGVPLFIINDKHSFSGAQDVELFLQIFSKL